MPSRPASGQPTSTRQRADFARAYTARDWELLTRLPARVVIAATSAEADSPRRTVAEGLAGIDAIAAGRISDSDLVRSVVGAIYAESEADGPVAAELGDRAAGLAGVLESCAAATRLLGRRADPADSAAYRQWLQSIAARVCGASRSGGVFGVGGVRVSPAERAFLDDLRVALRLG